MGSQALLYSLSKPPHLKLRLLPSVWTGSSEEVPSVVGNSEVNYPGFFSFFLVITLADHLQEHTDAAPFLPSEFRRLGLGRWEVRGELKKGTQARQPRGSAASKQTG